MCPENEAARLLPREHQPAMLMLDCSEYFPFVVKKWKNWRHNDIRASDTVYSWSRCFVTFLLPVARIATSASCLSQISYLMSRDDRGENTHSKNTDTRQWHCLSFFRPIKWFFCPQMWSYWMMLRLAEFPGEFVEPFSWISLPTRYSRLNQTSHRTAIWLNLWAT